MCSSDSQLQTQRPDLSIHAVKKLTPGYTVDDFELEIDQSLGLRITRSIVPELVGLYGDRLVELRLFGSWVRGQASTEFDIDVLVAVDRKMGPREEADVNLSLYLELMTRLDRVVELASTGPAMPILRTW